GSSLCAVADCFANKGVQIVRVSVPGVPFPLEIYNTHMQAQSDQEQIRIGQIDIIKLFMDRVHNPHLATVFAGDFNFKPTRGSYTYFRGKFPFFEEVGMVCVKSDSGCEIDSKTAIDDLSNHSEDHHFFVGADNGSVRIRPIYVVRNFTEKVSG